MTMSIFLDQLAVVVGHPLAFIAFIFTLIAWSLRGYYTWIVKRAEIATKFPKPSQLTALQLLILGQPSSITKNYLALVGQRYRFVSYIASVLALLVIAGLVSFNLANSNTQLGAIASTQETAFENINAQLTDLKISIDVFEGQIPSSLETVPSPENAQRIEVLRNERLALEAELTRYRTNFGELPVSVDIAAIDQAIELERELTASTAMISIPASIAWSRLTPIVRGRILNLLDGQRMASAEVASWSNGLRASRDQRHTLPWHYVSIPVSTGDYEPQINCLPACIISAINDQIEILSNESNAAQERSNALKHLITLVAETHRPLHCAERGGDLGGNRISVTGTARSPNLHSYWDSELLVDRLDGQSFDAYAKELAEDLTESETQAMEKGTVLGWALESHKIAAENIYPDVPIDGPYAIPSNYSDIHTDVLDRQIKRSGVRLAKLLNDIFG